MKMKRSICGGLALRTLLGLVMLALLMISNMSIHATASVIKGPITNPANNHNYYAISSNTWTGAEAEAQSLGGHLVTMNDDAENKWVWETFAPGPLWIGLSDAAQEGTFVWASGESAAYRKWWCSATDCQPGGLSAENYVEMNNYVWNDNSNAASFKGIVEVATDPPNTPSQPVGPSLGFAGTSYTYSISTTDPNNDQINYIFDWGDGSQNTTNFVNSGLSSSGSHSWTNPGTYNVKVMAKDTGGLTSGWSTLLVVTIEIKPITGNISIISSPSGADVYLDGASKGTAPVILNEISPGKHVIWCKKTGFEDLHQSIEVTSGNVAIVACALVQTPTPTSIPTTGSLSVFSMPSGASIYLDTVYKGDTPKTLTGVSTGTHNIELKFEGFKPWTDSINVEAASTSKVSASLVPAIPTVTTPPPTLTTLTPTPTIIIPTLTSTPPIGPPRDLVSIMAVLLIIMGSVLTALTTIKKDISLEVGVSERSLKYVGGAGILLIAIGAYLLLKAYDLT